MPTALRWSSLFWSLCFFFSLLLMPRISSVLKAGTPAAALCSSVVALALRLISSCESSLPVTQSKYLSPTFLRPLFQPPRMPGSPDFLLLLFGGGGRSKADAGTEEAEGPAGTRGEEWAAGAAGPFPLASSASTIIILSC